MRRLATAPRHLLAQSTRFTHLSDRPSVRRAHGPAALRRLGQVGRGRELCHPITTTTNSRPAFSECRPHSIHAPICHEVSFPTEHRRKNCIISLRAFAQCHRVVPVDNFHT